MEETVRRIHRMSARFPINIERMNCAWLTRVLREHDLLSQGSISRFTFEPVGGGYTSSVYRLLLEFDDMSTAAPDSLVVKFHSKSASIRERFENFGIYEKEIRFYQFVDTVIDLPVPICYAAEYDAHSGDFVLLLEDLSAARPAYGEVDPVSDIRTALPQLAKIHAQFWGDPRLQRFDWVVKPTEASTSASEKAEWADNLSKVKSEYRNLWPDRAWRTCDQITENWDDIMRCVNRDTHTLVHTDAHLGQMFFPTEDLPRYILFDWQYPCKSLAAEDVTHLIVDETSTEQRREFEAELVDLYYHSLCAAGVTDLSRERLWFQCKLALIWLIMMHFRTVAEPDLLQIFKDEADEAGENWEDWIFGQLGSTIEDWDLCGVLDQAIAEGRS
jgi:hypothetical protein